MIFSKRVHDNVSWKGVEIIEEDVLRIQIQHEQISSSILKKCLEEYPKDHNLAIALFNKRCLSLKDFVDSILENKAAMLVKHTNKVSKKLEGWMPCPHCGTKLKEYYRPGYQWFCGECKKFKVEADPDKIPKEV